MVLDRHEVEPGGGDGGGRVFDGTDVCPARSLPSGRSRTGCGKPRVAPVRCADGTRGPARGEHPGYATAPATGPPRTSRSSARRTSRGCSLPADRAYKVKKPLVLPFLDYGTPARRLAMCRPRSSSTAGSRPTCISACARSSRHGTAGLDSAPRTILEAVDYAVEMRRYAEDGDARARGSRAARAGALELAAVGARLAASTPIRPSGAPTARKRVKRALDDNFATLRSLLPATDGARGLSLAPSGSRLGVPRRRVGRARPRAAAGGRSATATATSGSSTCCSSAASRWSTASSSTPACAGSTSRLTWRSSSWSSTKRGRPDLAAALVSGYRAAGGDPGSDALLAFFAAYRAQVRAKVALTARGTAAAERAPAPRETARDRVVTLAERLQLVGAGAARPGRRRPLGVRQVDDRDGARRRSGFTPSARTWCASARRDCAARTGRRSRSTPPRRIARPMRGSARWLPGAPRAA